MPGFQVPAIFGIVSISVSPLRNIKLYYVGMFYNLFLPGGIGGDGYKVWMLRREFSSSWKSLILISFLERLNGLEASELVFIYGNSFLPIDTGLAVTFSLIFF